MDVRWFRLAPKTAVAESAVTARIEPNNAGPTGTELRPRPRSNVCRTPIRALGGAPALTKNATIREGRTAAATSPGRVACGSVHGRPCAEGEDRNDGHQSAQQEDERIKGESGGGIGKFDFTNQGER